jgi:UDP-N-acetylmuramoylalanine--D-glutamate ligase
MSDLAQRSVLILGLGESGLAMARWCLREGARVRVADTRDAPPNRDAAAALNVELMLGAFDPSLLEGMDLVAISPGLSPIAEPQSTLLATAKSAGIPVIGEIELFARKLAALKVERGYDPRVIAITGTNGKTTVTKLVGEMCRSANRSVVVAGNVSPAALDALSDVLDDALPEVWVLELSSFQLATTTTLAPTAATVLNVTQDHLDWHGTMDAYAKAKASIFAATTVRVINRDDPRVLAMDDEAAPSVRFGLDAPLVPGDLGLVRDTFDEEGLRWLALAEGADPAAEALGVVPGKAIGKRRAGRSAAVIPAGDVRSKRLMPVDALQLRGDHNVANVLAALALGRAIGLSMAAMLRAAGAYRGEPHRVAFVLERAGVDWIEDSKGTNVGATVAALRGLGRKVVLIAGGLGKGQDFSPLAAPVAQHARAVLLIGRDKALLRAALASTGVAMFDCETLDQAVDEAAMLAEPGDAVLLSPACASLDMFRDYEHRADVFVAAVHRIHRGIATIAGATC